MKQRVFNLIILDQSGSMYSIAREAVDGVNETIQTIRAAGKKFPEQEHYISLLAFNSEELKYIYDKAPAAEAEEMSQKQYRPNCSTPLYDAMGTALSSLRKFTAEKDRVLVTIITDGYENASTDYTAGSIRSLVDELKAKGWVFTYIGANQNVEKVAATISVTNTLCFSASPEGTREMFKKEATSRRRFFQRLSDNDDVCADNSYFAE